MPAISVLVADSQRLFADALAAALGKVCSNLEVLDERPEAGIDALEAILERKPDVALLDYWLQGMEAGAVTKVIRARAPKTKVVHLSWFHGSAQAKESLDSGAAWFLPKGLWVQEVHDAIHRVHNGDRQIFEPEGGGGEPAPAPEQPLSKLTPRKLAILELIAAGSTTEEIVQTLGISAHTVRNHIHDILKQTGTRSQVEAAAKAREHGLIPRSGVRGVRRRQQ